MKYYMNSVAIHTVILLVLLALWKLTPEQTEPSTTSIIVVDFSTTEEIAVAEQKTTPKKKKIERTNPRPPESTVPQAAPKSNNTSAMKSKVQDEADILAQEAIEKEKQRLREIERAKKKEAEAKRKQEAAKKAEKKSFFKSLFDKSKEHSENANAPTQPHGDASSGRDGNDNVNNPSNINGAISSRRVIYVPRIVDTTQKEGRVVVKICVNAKGSVVSADYVQVGSTTSDAHLIRLATEGAKKYRFSTSTKERECGRVVIDFTLRA